MKNDLRACICLQGSQKCLETPGLLSRRNSRAVGARVDPGGSLEVAQDAEKTKVFCELKAGRDAAKAERDTNGGVSFKECVRGGHIGDGRQAGGIVGHLRWKWRREERRVGCREERGGCREPTMLGGPCSLSISHL